jgi:hypothetical protein
MAVFSADGPDVWLSCVGEKAGLEANTHVKPAVGETTPAPDETGGRVGLVIKRPNHPEGHEVIKTSEDGVGKGKINVTRWDSSTRHLTGTATMTWDKDASGSAGSLRIEFDLPTQLGEKK